MPLSARTMKDKVWKRTGLSMTELLEPVIEEAISAALTEFSIYAPNTIFGYMPIFKDVTDYAFPLVGSPPQNLLNDISDFFYGGTDIVLGNFSVEDLMLMNFQGQGSLFSAGFGGNVFNNPSLIKIWFTKLSAFRDSIGLFPWSVIDGANSIIRLGRNPSSDGTAYFQGNASWTIDQIDPLSEEIFMKCLMWKVAEGRAMKLAVVDDYYEYGGIRIRPAFDFWQKKSAEYKEQFYSDIGSERGVIQIG